MASEGTENTAEIGIFLPNFTPFIEPMQITKYLPSKVCEMNPQREVNTTTSRVTAEHAKALNELSCSPI
jgi:hypothetical protein